MSDPQEQAVRELQAVLARSGAQDAAHTALEHARTQAAHTARQAERAAERAAARERAAAEAQRRQTRPLPGEHARAVRQLAQCRAEREQLHTGRDALHHNLQQTREELEALPWWARGRRRALTDTITSSEQRLRQTEPTQATLDAEVDRLTRLVAHHSRQRQASDLSTQHRPPGDRWDLTRALEQARRGPAPVSGHNLTATGTGGPEPYRGPARDGGGGLSR